MQQQVTTYGATYDVTKSDYVIPDGRVMYTGTVTFPAHVDNDPYGAQLFDENNQPVMLVMDGVQVFMPAEDPEFSVAMQAYADDYELGHWVSVAQGLLTAGGNES